jgi:multiple sugar transport system permease protein
MLLTRQTRRTIRGWVWNLIALFIILLPITSLILGAIQTEASLLTDVRNPLPSEITLQNFVVLITGNVSNTSYPTQVEDFPIAFMNSAIVSLSVSVLTIVFGAFSAYSLARLRFPGKNSYSFLVLATRMVPVIALVIPLFLTFRGFGLLNTLLGIIVAETGFLLPFVVWLLRAYFEGLPYELEDAARVDGCTRFRAFLQIVIPLSTPGLAATFVIVFLLSWNELLIPITLASQKQVQTLPVMLSSLFSDYSLQYSVVNATALLALTPTVILALLLQKYVVAGLTAGALKG